MSTELMLASGLNDAQRVILEQRTPAEVVRYREGRGGMKFAYVPHAWVNRVLNEAFGFRWSWEVIDTLIVPDTVNPAEVIVRGRLTVTAPDGGLVVKEQFGTADVKRLKNGGVISLGDDLKAASSDAMKKAASMLGVALDLYGASDDPLPGEQSEPAEKKPQAQGKPQPATGNGTSAAKSEPLPPRPWQPQTLAKVLHAKAEANAKAGAGTGMGGFFGAMQGLMDEKPYNTDMRHSFFRYVFGVESGNDLAPNERLALTQWAKPDKVGDEWTWDAQAAQEYALVIEAIPF